MNNLISLQKLFSQSLFRVPDYQRGYSWGKLQLEEFWTDLIDLLEDRDHYVGMLTLKEINEEKIELENKKYNEEKWLIKEEYTLYEVVDGQQRLTTIIILINSILNYYRKLEPNREDSEILVNKSTLDRLKERYLVIKEPGSTIIETFKFGYDDLEINDFFKYKIIKDDEMEKIEENFYTLKLLNAKIFFETKLDELVKEKGRESLGDLIRKITQRLKFNMFYIKDEFNVFTAFETMNNRGKRLSYLELLKNRLIYLTTVLDIKDNEKNKLRDEINSAWKIIYSNLGKNKEQLLDDNEFLQAHWRIYFGPMLESMGGQKTNYNNFLLNQFFTQQNIKGLVRFDESVEISEEDIKASLNELEEVELSEENNKDTKSNQEERITAGSIRKYIKSLQSLSEHWYRIFYPEEEKNSEIKKYLIRLKRLGYAYFEPLTIVVLSNKHLSDTEKVEMLKKIERYIFLHFRLENYSQTYRRPHFYKLAHDFYENKNDKTYRIVMNSLDNIDFLTENKVIKMEGLLNRINRLFNKQGFYTWGTKNYLLFEYERKLSEKTKEDKIVAEDFFGKKQRDYSSIEHIYPQNDTDEIWKEAFKDYTDKEKNRLKSSLGNLLPLTTSINSSLQNYTFEEKKNRKDIGYKNGSNSAIEVAQETEWKAEQILKRGLKIVSFIEDEFEVKFPSYKDKVKFLGLEFMLKDENEKGVLKN